MIRRDDWYARLKEYIRDCQVKQFEYGKHDCALFAAGAVMAMTDEDFARGFRGYKTLTGGVRKLKEMGHASHADLAASLLDEIHPSRASVGDIALVDGESLGVVQGRGIYAVTETGVSIVPRERATRAFKV